MHAAEHEPHCRVIQEIVDAADALDASRIVFWEDLLGFRRRGGLPDHGEMSGKTHFLKLNTGPSGHGLLIAAGQILALRQCGTIHAGRRAAAARDRAAGVERQDRRRPQPAALRNSETGISSGGTP